MSRLDAAEIYAQALEYEDPGARTTYLHHACEHDPRLRQRVEALLGARAARGDFLDEPLVVPGMTPRGVEAPGTVIGPYVLLEEIGEGGMGVVYMAQQSAPIKRRVALKILKPGLDTRAVIARFEAERQALALMDHPSIARIFDAGTADSGRPYFVMELVQGVPITDYCDACQLTVRERLEVLIAVCQAVQHAHEKKVIHRDLKPTNVLVAVQDGRPLPKIIDFGVAKAIGHRLTDSTLATGFAQMVGTPLYMSPEQAELSPIGVDERSDVYALGVLLYELLTGTTPFDKAQLHDASLDELRRIIREVEPLRPSLRFSTLGNELATTVVDRRRTSGRVMRQLLRGELEWIAMRCLEKNRVRRYASASELAADLGRYLANQPVAAGPPTALYKISKFSRRHTIAVGIIALCSFSILATVSVIGLRSRDQATKAAAESLHSDAVTLMREGNFEAAETALNEVLRLQPDWSEPWWNRGVVRLKRRHIDAATRDLIKACELAPSDVETLVSAGDLCMSHGRWTEAKIPLRLALKEDPNYVLVWYRRAALSLHTRDVADYQFCCEQMIERFADTSSVMTAEVTAKTCLIVPNSLPDLQPVFKLAALVASRTEREGDPGWNRVLSALVAYRRGDAAAAIKQLNDIPAPIDPDPGCFEGHAYALRVLAYLRLGQAEEAAICMRKARECLAKWPNIERGELFDVGGKGDWLRFRILFDEAANAMKSSERQTLPPASGRRRNALWSKS